MVMKRRSPVEGRLLALATTGLFAACAPRGGDLGMPGVSDRTPDPAESRPAASGPSGEPWEHAAALASFPVIDDRKLPSRGHNPPYWSGMVRVSPSLDVAYRNLGPDTAITVGAIAVEQHQLSDGNPGPVFVMIKRDPGFDPRGGDWEYLVLDAAGKVESRGVQPLCARCHADAPYDHLFGPRVSSRRRIGTGGDGPTEAGQPDEDEATVPEGALPTGTKPGQKPYSKKKKRLASSRRGAPAPASGPRETSRSARAYPSLDAQNINGASGEPDRAASMLAKRRTGPDKAVSRKKERKPREKACRKQEGGKKRPKQSV